MIPSASVTSIERDFALNPQLVGPDGLTAFTVLGDGFLDAETSRPSLNVVAFALVETQHRCELEDGWPMVLQHFTPAHCLHCPCTCSLITVKVASSCRACFEQMPRGSDERTLQFAASRLRAPKIRTISSNVSWRWIFKVLSSPFCLYPHYMTAYIACQAFTAPTGA